MRLKEFMLDERQKKFYDTLSILQVEKEVRQLQKRAGKESLLSMGEMGFNGHRSIRKARSSHAAGMFSMQIHDLEIYLRDRKKMNN